MINKPQPPYVYITGAGPGNPDLLTLKTHELITKIADIVVYDRLIPEAIIGLIPNNVEKTYAGKSCKKHHMTQEEINACLVEEAKNGKVVVRLKGGDPFIFGRGGEEALYLMENNIPFEIVPGVNAADGCCAYQGIPLTHRGLATGVRFITGHQQKGEAAHLDWESLADEDTTLVIYMGLTNLRDIQHNLIKHGLPANTPAAAIQEGTMKSEKVCITSLEKIFKETQKLEFQPPTLIIIGKVVSLGKILKSKII